MGEMALDLYSLSAYKLGSVEFEQRESLVFLR